ncbi:MAG: hypothetical protein KF773_15970 [Deltaproteobacteria bacterium]|nr:hypothetical protein [Deltaproteobacteria bacterium]
MVEWYEPLQLARTGVAVATSTILGRHADQRLVEALSTPSDEYYDYAARDELWIDYVADAGDGFDSTYAVARAVAMPELALGEHVTRRGRILVLGGDLTYPVASREQYERRLEMPYQKALPHSDAPHPDLYAVPGNHDWYDSLVAFTRRFCAKRWFAGWRTQQRRSYFAVKLPRGWWLIGTDVQLGSDIDAEQLAYFRDIVASKMEDGDNVILCNAEPHWLYAEKYGGGGDEQFLDSNLRYLEETVFGDRIRIFIAGDLHHYRRHTTEDGYDHKIIAGGGGAFLHPTHDKDVDRLPPPARAGAGDFVQLCTYPTVKDSRRITWCNLLLLRHNLRLGLVTGLLYLLTAQSMRLDLSKHGIGDAGTVLGKVFHALVTQPASLLWVLALVGGTVLFTDTHVRRYRVLGGTAHALVHLLATLAVGWTAGVVAARWGLTGSPWYLVCGVLIFAGGCLVGTFVLGAYLLVSLNVFGRHGNEAFSSLRSPDWKNFLRLHIRTDGTLLVYPIGIRRVPRRWTRDDRPAPDDPRATAPALIEGPIVVPSARGALSTGR